MEVIRKPQSYNTRIGFVFATTTKYVLERACIK